MDQIASLAFGASKTRRANDDDFVDRLSSRYTVIILVVFAVLVSMNQYVRNPITCWAPVHFTDAHTKFTIAYCWVKNTYYLPWDEELPRDEGPEYRQMVPYYQWIPFILLGQAVLFYVPSIVWHALNSKAGVDSDNIMQTVHTMMRIENGDTRDDLQLLMTNLIDRFLVNRAGPHPKRSGIRWKALNAIAAIRHRIFSIRSGTYLLVLFLFSKICYILNAIGQLIVLNYVLGAKYHTFGYDVLRDVVAKHDWTEESYVAFPRVTLCDFKIRGQDLGNTQRYTVQCVLPINLYVEKIYMFLWFWMVGVAALSIISFLVWLMRGVFVKDQIKFVGNHLVGGGQVHEFQTASAELIEAFTVKYLQQDGAFLLRLIAHNTSNVTTTEIICALWNSWREKEREKKNESRQDPNSETLALKKSTE